jgi:hypothetical protein
MTSEDNRDTAAPREWRETHREVRGPVDEEIKRGEPGSIPIYEGGEVLTNACGDCGRNHHGRE